MRTSIAFLCALLPIVTYLLSPRETTAPSMHLQEVNACTINMCVQATTTEPILPKPKPKPVYKKVIHKEPPPEIKQLITSEAEARGVDANLALRIARCESGYRVDAKNVNANGTIDGGLFQINDVHTLKMAALGMDRWNAEDNVQYAMMLLEQNGTADFKASRHCWSL